MQVQGIIPAMVTPIKDTQEIDFLALDELIERLIDNGASSIFILGTNGEFHMLNNKEKIELTKYVSKIINGRVPLIVGTGGNSTQEVIELSKEVIKAGADILSIITPYFIQPNSEELKEHYLEIANTLRYPILIYNIPKLTGLSIDHNIVRELSLNEFVIGIKDSSGDINNIRNYIQNASDDSFSVICGTDSLILDSLKIGAKGAIASTANVVPDIVCSIYDSWKEENDLKAQLLQESLFHIRDLFKEGTIPSVLKSFVNNSGINVGIPKRPTLPVDNDLEEEVKKNLEKYDKIRRNVL